MKQEGLFIADEKFADSLSGAVERITFYSDEDDYAVIRLRPSGMEDLPGDALDRNKLVAVVGKMPGIRPGETMRSRGRWILHSTYGRQFECSHLETDRPGDINGLKIYLQQLVKGIGKVTIDRVFLHFGEREMLRIVEEEPKRLLEMPGVKLELLEELVTKINDRQESRAAMQFLFGLGITAGIAKRIYDQYKAETEAKIRDNPYLLAREVHGIGFQRADEIARSIGVRQEEPKRIRACFRYSLEKAARDDGNTFLPKPVLLEEVRNYLELVSVPQVENELAASIEQRELREEEFPSNGILSPAIYLPEYFRTETMVAGLLLRQLVAPSIIVGAQVSRILDQIKGNLQHPLTSNQRKAILNALQEKVSILTGGPGTGKTETLRALIQVLDKLELSFALASPTGRAAKRMSQASGSEAKTIHRLLGIQFDGRRPRPSYHQDNPLQYDFVIVDETSMMDLLLFRQLLEALKPEAHLFLIGDAEQLPSVGAGRVLGDCIDSEKIPVTRLREIFRQKEGSSIIRNAMRVSQGKLPSYDRDPDHGEFFFANAREPARAVELVLEIVCERIPRRFGLDPLQEVQVLSPQHSGLVGVQNLNRQLQARLNPPQGKAEFKTETATFRVGDRLMQTRNDYQREVFNGDIGYLRAIDPEEQKFVVRFDHGDCDYRYYEAENLMHAYCITTHKSQGSEYPAIVMPILQQHYIMLQRNLFYTAITRAQRLVVLVGTQRAILRAVENNRVEERYSGLLPRLRGEVKKGGLGGRRRKKTHGRRLSDLLEEEKRHKPRDFTEFPTDN